MKRAGQILTVLLFIVLSAVLTGQSIKELDRDAEKLGFTYEIPSGCKQVPTVKQDDLLYHAGFKNSDGVEFRLSSWDDREMFRGDYESCRRQFMMLVMTMAANVSNDSISAIDFMDDSFAQKDFGGDMAVMFIAKADSDFAKGYKNVFGNVVYKKGKIVALTVLVNDLDTFKRKLSTAEYKSYMKCFRFK